MEDNATASAIAELFASATVVLLRADVENDATYRILSSRPSPDVFTDSDMLAEWIASEQNTSLADLIIDVGRCTPIDVACSIATALTNT